ncbi:MAG: DUF1080 domain-containing protein [Planctomycetaceae bacterium]|nr:DUF1080 domain-containing protein [Planctomycetaceae bacterium]
MKKFIAALFVFCAVSFSLNTICFGQVALFEKTNLNEWIFFTDKAGVKVDDVFSFTADKVLRCKGQPFGYLATKENYKNYKLSLEYRWVEGEKPTNSGIFLRITDQPDKTFLPKTFEVQLAHNSAGDLWGFHGRTQKAPEGTDPKRYIERNGGDMTGETKGVKRLVGNEKEPGQWNCVDLLVQNGLIVIVFNGTIVNWVTDAEVVDGKIGFQSEGGPIEFRNAVLTVLP